MDVLLNDNEKKYPKTYKYIIDCGYVDNFIILSYCGFNNSVRECFNIFHEHEDRLIAIDIKLKSRSGPYYYFEECYQTYDGHFYDALKFHIYDWNNDNIDELFLKALICFTREYRRD